MFAFLTPAASWIFDSAGGGHCSTLLDDAVAAAAAVAAAVARERSRDPLIHPWV